MEVLFIPARPGRIARFFFGITAEYITVGVVSKLRGGEKFPTVAIKYPEVHMPEVLKILGIMQMRGLVPEVYFDRTGSRIELVVLFRLIVGPEFILELIVGRPVELNLHEIEEEVEIELTLSAESDYQKDGLQNFFEEYAREGNFRVQVVESSGPFNDEIWGVQVESFIEGYPELDP